MCKTGQDVMVDGIPHHPVSWSWQQSQPARGETRGPGQGSLAVLPPSCFESGGFWVRFAYGAEVRRRDSGGCGQADEWKDTHAFLVTGLDCYMCYSAQV